MAIKINCIPSGTFPPIFWNTKKKKRFRSIWRPSNGRFWKNEYVRKNVGIIIILIEKM